MTYEAADQEVGSRGGDTGGLLAEPLDSVARSAQDIPTLSHTAHLLHFCPWQGLVFLFSGRMSAFWTAACTSLQSIMPGPGEMLTTPLQEDVPSCVLINSECFGVLSSCLFQSGILHSFSRRGVGGAETESRQASRAQRSFS